METGGSLTRRDNDDNRDNGDALVGRVSSLVNVQKSELKQVLDMFRSSVITWLHIAGISRSWIMI